MEVISFMITDMQKLVRDYKAGRISEAEIKELEKECGKSIEEIIANINKILYLKKHRLDTMTITDIRMWMKKKKVSDEEKQLYADMNKCTYEEAFEKAKTRLEEFDDMQEFKELDRIFGLTPETREEKRKYCEWLIDSGLGKLDGDAVVVESDNFLEFMRSNYKASKKSKK